MSESSFELAVEAHRRGDTARARELYQRFARVQLGNGDAARHVVADHGTG